MSDKNLDVIKNRRGTLTLAALQKIQEVSPSGYKMISEDMLWLISEVERLQVIYDILLDQRDVRRKKNDKEKHD